MKFLLLAYLVRCTYFICCLDYVRFELCDNSEAGVELNCDT